LRLWQTRLLRIILNPAMILAWGFGLWLIHIDVSARGAALLAEPWMVAKLIGVLLLSGWHGFLAAQRKKIAAGTSKYSGKFWRMTNEVPFVLAIIMVLSVTTEWTFG
ncbi:CopD family protein, partial [Brevundimonas sp.]